MPEVRGLLLSGPFARIGDATLEGLASSAQALSFKHGERVWSPGDEGTVAWVVEGALDVIHHDEVVDTLGPGQMLGLSALWGKPHSAEVKARRTDRERTPEILLWDVTKDEVLRMFRSPEVLSLLLQDAFGLIHHLNVLQVLYRRKRGAAAHIATHLRRLASFRNGAEVEIGQKELGELAGYDERTVRMALVELGEHGVTNPRRSVYCLDLVRLDEFIEREERGGTHPRAVLGV